MTDHSDMPAPAPPRTPPTGPPPFRPVLLIFLAMPLFAAGVALLITADGPEGAGGSPTPPVVGFTPFTLVGAPAPDFTLATPEGSAVQLSSLQGQWVLLNFWATWCGPCRAEMPLFQELADGQFEGAPPPSEGVIVLAVNRDEPVEAVNAFLDELELRLPVALDAGARVSAQYGVMQLPLTYVIDPAGVVRYKHIGELTRSTLARYLEQMAAFSITAPGG
jgi:cytochrome c biogenesis protein CcmG/thiol:disulfide interchange protein DsbE